MEALGWSLQICIKLWIYVFVGICILSGLFSWSMTFHMIAVGLLLILLAYFKLPRPDHSVQVSVLGPDPRNFDGSPSKSKRHIGLIAHRAGGDDEMPENTIGALREAKEKGIKCVEFDVSLSADGIPFVFHDDKLDRLAVNAKGYFAEYNAEEIKQFRVKNKLIHPEEDARVESIPTLEEFLEECIKLELKMIMDVKDFFSVNKSVEVVLKMFKKYPMLYTSCLVSSFHPGIIYKVRYHDPKIVCGMAWRPYFLSCESYTGSLLDARPRWDTLYQHYMASIGDMILKWAYHNVLWHFMGISAVVVHKAIITPEYVQMWRERGIRVLVWTVNDTLEKIYFTKSLRITPISDAIDPISDERFLSSICEEESEA